VEDPDMRRQQAVNRIFMEKLLPMIKDDPLSPLFCLLPHSRSTHPEIHLPGILNEMNTSLYTHAISRSNNGQNIRVHVNVLANFNMTRHQIRYTTTSTPA
jgi:hypothetical protein